MAEQQAARPLSDEAAEGEVLRLVGSAIASGDRSGALRMLQAFVEGELELSTLSPIVGDALVATARGVERDDTDRTAPRA